MGIVVCRTMLRYAAIRDFGDPDFIALTDVAPAENSPPSQRPAGSSIPGLIRWSGIDLQYYIQVYWLFLRFIPDAHNTPE